MSMGRGDDMPGFARKVLWIVSMNAAGETRLAKHARDCGVHAVCIRTTNDRLPDAIGRFHQLGLQVYAWRWPAVRPNAGTPPHYFADEEAKFVVEKLLPAKLDGYIV